MSEVHVPPSKPTGSSDATEDAPAQSWPTQKRCVMIYSRYERFWHWSQALLIFILAISGFNLHGTIALMDFRQAVFVHTFAALALIALWALTTFWHFTTGQWRQYLPAKGIGAVIYFYLIGILRGAPHPYVKTLQRKQNALQSLAYLTFMALIGPVLWISGILYLAFPLWRYILPQAWPLATIAFVHTAGAYMIAAFVIIHVYMTTTGKTVGHYIKTMITGYDRIDIDLAQESYLKSIGSKIFK